MLKRSNFANFLGAALLVSACASIPDVEIGYQLPKTVGKVVVTRNLSCDVKDSLFVVSSVTPELKNVASDAPEDRWSIGIQKLGGVWADTKAIFSLHSDGRLAGVNSESTGKGGAVLNAAAAIAGAVIFTESQSTAASTTLTALCNYINGNEKRKDGAALRSKSLSLTFSANINGLIDGSFEVLEADRRTKLALVQITEIIDENQLGVITAELSWRDPPLNDANACTVPICATTDESDIRLKLRAPRAALIKLSLGGAKLPIDLKETLNTGVLIAQRGTDYYVPIPKPALFGGSSFELALNEADMPTKLSYGKASGAEQVLDTGSALLDAIREPSSADQAAAVKGEADLILQRQRLLKCQADPTTCE